MKKKLYVLGMAVLVAALLALSGVAQSAMWVGAELGFNMIPSYTVFNVNGHDFGSSRINASVIGGMALGYDFVNSGFGAANYPDWMKYFSIVTDLTYNRLVIEANQDHNSGIATLLPNGSRSNGYAVVWSFLVMAHYGFFPDSEVPSGRVNPYIAVGPGIAFTGLNLKNVHSESTDVALVAEGGVRFMALKNVSIDTAFRYRMIYPQWSFNNLTARAVPLDQFSFLVRANYHF
jgi:opacity protein-like surface antigen